MSQVWEHVVTCDRCSKECRVDHTCLGPSDWPKDWTWTQQGRHPNTDRPLDLCPECSRTFREWLNSVQKLHDGAHYHVTLQT